MDHLFP